MLEAEFATVCVLRLKLTATDLHTGVVCRPIQMLRSRTGAEQGCFASNINSHRSEHKAPDTCTHTDFFY
jgi:hypothetical protein